MWSLQATEKCLNCLNWTFQTKVIANRTWTNHSQPFVWMLIYDTITTNFDEENTFDLSVHVNEVITSYTNLLELFKLDLLNKGYG